MEVQSGITVASRARFQTDGQVNYYNLDAFKGTHTVYFSSSLYIINQNPVIPITHFLCITTWVACFSG